MKNAFDHRSMEKTLFAMYMPRAGDKHRTRKFLRKMARNIERAWQIGRKDGAEGKPFVTLDELTKNDDTPMGRKMIRHAFVAYQAGYLAGKRGD